MGAPIPHHMLPGRTIHCPMLPYGPGRFRSQRIPVNPWGCCDHVGPPRVGMVGIGFSACFRGVLPLYTRSTPRNSGWHPTSTYMLVSRGNHVGAPGNQGRTIPRVVGTALAMVGSAGPRSLAGRVATSVAPRHKRPRKGRQTPQKGAQPMVTAHTYSRPMPAH